MGKDQTIRYEIVQKKILKAVREKQQITYKGIP